MKLSGAERQTTIDVHVNAAACEVAVGQLDTTYGTGRIPFVGWELLGLFFSILTLIVVIVIPSKKS